MIGNNLNLAAIAAPPGGRIYFIKVPTPVDFKRPWRAAINAAQGTGETNDNYRVVGNQLRFAEEGRWFSDTESGRLPNQTSSLVLVNFTSGCNHIVHAKEWSRQYRLRWSRPREVFALGEYHPRLYEEVGAEKYLEVVATTICEMRGFELACKMRWDAPITDSFRPYRRAGTEEVLHWVPSLHKGPFGIGTPVPVELPSRFWFAFSTDQS